MSHYQFNTQEPLMQFAPKRRNILLSAYACEPHRGSEPGVGWEWATRLAMRHAVTVITRSNNQEAIESALENGSEVRQPKFIYIDLPEFWIRLKKRGLLPVAAYYLLWQLTARFVIRDKLKDFDLVHHATFNGFRFPGAWWRVNIPVVLGPLGGGSIAAQPYRRCFGGRWFSERVRGWSVRLWKWNPWTLASLLGSDAVLAVGKEMAGRFASIGINADLMLETAVPSLLEAEPELIPGAKRRDFLIVGNLEPWKGWQIAFEAFARVYSSGIEEHRLVVIGTGRQLEEARRLSEDLGIADQVEFAGLQSREELWRRVANARALVFPSVRDTSGNAALEAMALACPVICFRHQGVAWMTDDSCAIRIEPGDWDTSVQGFVSAMGKLAADDLIVESMGKAGRLRAMEEFSWDAKIRRIEEIYARVTK